MAGEDGKATDPRRTTRGTITRRKLAGGCEGGEVMEGMSRRFLQLLEDYSYDRGEEASGIEDVGGEGREDMREVRLRKGEVRGPEAGGNELVSRLAEVSSRLGRLGVCTHGVRGGMAAGCRVFDFRRWRAWQVRVLMMLRNSGKRTLAQDAFDGAVRRGC